MGFTEMESGSYSESAPASDRHSSVPAADTWTTWPWLSATQQEPSVGFTETESGS